MENQTAENDSPPGNSSAKVKIISMDEYKKRRVLMADQTEKSNSSEIIQESSVEVAPESVTWKLLPVRNKRPAIYYHSSSYVRQDSLNGVIIMIPNEKVPLEKISLDAFRDLPLPSYRSTVPISRNVSISKSLPEAQNSDNDKDDDIFAELAEILNFKNEFPNVASTPIYSPDPQSSQQSVDDRSSQEVSRDDEYRRYSETKKSGQERKSRSKRRNEDSTDRNDRKRRRRSSGRRSRSWDRNESLYESMLRARDEHEKTHRSPLKNVNFAHRNTRRSFYSSRTSEPRRPSQHRGGRSQRFNNNRAYSNRNQRGRVSYARRSWGSRR